MIKQMQYLSMFICVLIAVGAYLFLYKTFYIGIYGIVYVIPASLVGMAVNILFMEVCK